MGQTTVPGLVQSDQILEGSVKFKKKKMEVKLLYLLLI